MSDEPNYDEDMKLPPGKTCADCFASRFCIGIGCTTPERTTCDYWPNRFRERRSSGIAPAQRVPQPTARPRERLAVQDHVANARRGVGRRQARVEVARLHEPHVVPLPVRNARSPSTSSGVSGLSAMARSSAIFASVPATSRSGSGLRLGRGAEPTLI